MFENMGSVTSVDGYLDTAESELLSDEAGSVVEVIQKYMVTSSTKLA